MGSLTGSYTHPGDLEPNEPVGVQQGLRHVWDSVRLVARTDSTVLIHGETGTGKELVAGAIHRQGTRSHGPYVKLNCAAMPAGLLESELFGYERGAFTGAFTPFSGRFQLADGGTLFLDEIGDLPLELQPKLLRVLQEQEFERLGSTRTVHIDVRVIAATNHNLRQLVQAGRFRADLFYRLNVFPIAVPRLRDRPEDIPLLVAHFAGKFAARMNKVFAPVSADTMEVLKKQEWGGNVRELENFVHRAVIWSPGPELHFPFGDLFEHTEPEREPPMRTLAEAERAHILQVLRQSGGVVGGKQGAAARLGVARTTLLYRMRKLGIEG